MQDSLPFYESPEEAITACIQALGGAKKVGPMLWPDKTVDASRTLLLDCLNASRKEKLDLSQILFIFKQAKEIGFHAGIQWFCMDAGYEAKPITRAEEVDRLTSVIEQASKTLSSAVQALERVQTRVDLRTVK
ncbi:MAG: hypothetical protein KGL39_11125 [Patescibacteria group bacterium]|nr:hypothetical protein [Patescibacteria group bacterium]